MVPRRVCKQTGLGDGCFYSNIAVLTGDTAHTYLHTIEEIDPDMFFDITSELIDENIKRRIELENLKRIREILLSFEKEHEGEIKKHNQLLIKPEYIEKRIKLWLYKWVWVLWDKLNFLFCKKIVFYPYTIYA